VFYCNRGDKYFKLLFMNENVYEIMTTYRPIYHNVFMVDNAERKTNVVVRYPIIPPYFATSLSYYYLSVTCSQRLDGGAGWKAVSSVHRSL